MSVPLERLFARFCVWCPLCRRARRTGKGLAYRFVDRVEKDLCPFCRAYEKVYGKPAGKGPHPDGKPGEVP